MTDEANDLVGQVVEERYRIETVLCTERVFVAAAFAETLEALAPCRPKKKPGHEPSLTRNSLPWYAIGLAVGAVAAALVAGVLA